MMNRGIHIKNILMRTLHVCLVVLSVLSINDLSASGSFDMEVDELKKEVHSMKTIVEPVFNSTVHRYIKYYMDASDEYSLSMLERSALYFPYIESELRNSGLPEELKYLVVVESSVKPDVRSRVGASGLWQLMIPTARYCGLEINYWVDERLDPRASTKAAIIYLKELYSQFSDWSLVMAAYNCGPGRVRKAIRYAGSEDYWKVARYLPGETRRYVPKFIAAQYAFDKALHGEMQNFKVPLDLLFTTEVKLTSQTSLQEVASVTKVSLELLKELNPSWRRGVLGNASGDYTLRLPSRVLDYWLEFELSKTDNVSHLESKPERYVPGTTYLSLKYEVQEESKLDEIAEQIGIQPYLIHYWNQKIPGQIVSKGEEIQLYLPDNHECYFIGAVLRDATDIEFLPQRTMGSSLVSSTHKFSVSLPKLDDASEGREVSAPVIVPRGMSYVEFRRHQ